MDINATLLGQMITFALFVVITLKYIWPLFKKVLDERAQKIADGLAAAARGHHELAMADQQAQILVQAAKQQASNITATSLQRAQSIVEQAKAQARVEAERILASNRHEIAQEVQMARENLRQEVTKLAVLGAEKILRRHITQQDAEKLLADAMGEL